MITAIAEYTRIGRVKVDIFTECDNNLHNSLSNYVYTDTLTHVATTSSTNFFIFPLYKDIIEIIIFNMFNGNYYD